jgi:sortase A
MIRKLVLSGLEILLLIVGTGLVVWCEIVLIRMYYVQNMPVPEPEPLVVTETLPGDPGSAPRTRVPTPKRGAWVARLEAPSVSMKTTVLEGTYDGTLDRGAGHIEETPLPGQIGNIGIAGHRDTVFRPLRKIRIGDPLQLTTRDRIYHFQITSTTIVDPRDVHVLNPTAKPTLTLVTCYPFEFIGSAPRRFIVQARLVTEELRTH